MSASIDLDSNARKKPRLNGRDIISNLPPTIIRHILSLLPAKDVLRTSVLSKAWEYKWTCIYNIHIDEKTWFSRKKGRTKTKTKTKSVVNFVDRILLFSRATIKSFHLSCSYKYSPTQIITWISAVVMRNVEDLQIDYDHKGVILPRCLFNCTSLSRLKLGLPCTFRVPVENWSSNVLKILHLDKVEILNDSCVSDTLVLDFPVLETIELCNCKWLKVKFVEIKAPALTKFNVVHHSLPKGVKCQIRIFGAKLLKFDLYGHFVESIDLSMSSVFSAVVDCRSTADDFVVIRKDGLFARSLLKECFGISRLRLSGDVVEGFARSKRGTALPKFNMLKRLELVRKCKIGALLEMLHVMPYLESTTFYMLQWHDYDYEEVKSVPTCITNHLNEVQFHQFSGKPPHIHLADFLLTNAVRLKKMLGLFRKKHGERKIEKNFWEKLKRVYGGGNFELGSSVQNMTDFELLFG
ncbi:F-box/FBD/LRR-repeat protein At3g14710-like [Henckelia pumila]|uniref:F-box/FBD/LRR-repeat protein At3g14710-like n=1 Tax=Henckelia pumila TaxID=405737 RepID=UPI003C6E6091